MAKIKIDTSWLIAQAVGGLLAAGVCYERLNNTQKREAQLEARLDLLRSTVVELSTELAALRATVEVVEQSAYPSRRSR